MKKITWTLMALLVAATLVLTACSSDNTTPSETDAGTEDVSNEEAAPADVEQVPEEEDQDEEEETGGEADADGGEVMAQIVSEAQAALDLMKPALGDTMDIDLSAKGNSLVFTFTILEDFSELTDDDIAEMDAAFNEQVESLRAAMFDPYFEMLKDGGVDNATIIITFNDMNGNEIYSSEIK